MSLGTNAKRFFFLFLILMNVSIPVAESIEFESGLRVGETGCAGGTGERWEFGVLPEFWFVMTKLDTDIGEEDVEGPMFGMSGFATKNYPNGSFTLYGGFRYGEFDVDGEATFSGGRRNRYKGELEQLQSELRARWLFQEKLWDILCSYVTGGIAYTKLSQEDVSLSPGWTYSTTGSKEYNEEEIYFTAIVGLGFIWEMSEKWVARFEVTLNGSYGKEKLKNAHPGVDDSDEGGGVGYGYLYTLLYRLTDTFHIQGGIRGEGLNQYFEGDEAPQFAYHGLFFRVSLNF